MGHLGRALGLDGALRKGTHQDGALSAGMGAWGQAQAPKTSIASLCAYRMSSLIPGWNSRGMAAAGRRLLPLDFRGWATLLHYWLDGQQQRGGAGASSSERLLALPSNAHDSDGMSPLNDCTVSGVPHQPRLFSNAIKQGR